MLRLGLLQVITFGKSVRDNEAWPNTSDQWQTSDNFNSYETYTLVIFDNMDQSLSYNGSSIDWYKHCVQDSTSPYTKKYSVTVPDNNAHSIEFKKNGQGPRQLCLQPQIGPESVGLHHWTFLFPIAA